ncbi:MAG: hypothetical protein HY040_21040 [Planctomycetes bacterium]|nr:hypothetical protein [Planctomycetota bacterium]
MGTAKRKRWLCSVALAGLLCVFGSLYLLLWPVSHHVDLDHLQLIAPGMTEAEVEAIFGVPPGCYDGAVPDKRFAIEVLIPFSETLEEKVPIDQLAFSGKTMFLSSRHGPTRISRVGSAGTVLFI